MLRIAVCLLCSASPMDTKSFTASFLLGKHLLPQNCIFPSSRGTKPSLRHFCAHMVLVPHLWHCSFSLQIEKSCLPQENCPFPQNTLQTPLYFFVLPSWEKRKAAVTFPSLSILTLYRCLMDMTTLDAQTCPGSFPLLLAALLPVLIYARLKASPVLSHGSISAPSFIDENCSLTQWEPTPGKDMRQLGGLASLVRGQQAQTLQARGEERLMGTTVLDMHSSNGRIRSKMKS